MSASPFHLAWFLQGSSVPTAYRNNLTDIPNGCATFWIERPA
ncbi:MAG: hypothetical protein ABSC06_10515 [Rhodopila sp.]|jgi:hypothetical protein